MKAHLLYPDRDFDFDGDLPPGSHDLVKDLELDIVLNAMAGGNRQVHNACMRVLLDRQGVTAEVITYRQAVLADCVAHFEAVQEISDVARTALGKHRRGWAALSHHASTILRGAVAHLDDILLSLKELRRLADRHASKFSSPGMRQLMRVVREQLDDHYLGWAEEHLEALKFYDGTTVSARLTADNTATDFVLHDSEPPKRGSRKKRAKAKDSLSFTLAPKDEAGARILVDLADRGLNDVANAVAQSADHIVHFLSQLSSELAFYLACADLRTRLAKIGVPVSFPEPQAPGPGRLQASDLQDVSLALRTGAPVVGNDFDADGKGLVVVTGANSGGKSTFLRSLGQAQAMMEAGMFVVAGSYRVAISTGMFTHFVREEDSSMRRGRLDDELARMSRIVNVIRPGGVLLLNESFSATNEQEGSEIARQVVHALVDRGVTVAYVTHLYDFAESVARSRADSTLFLRAERGAEGRRPFKLTVGPPLPTSFGADIYERIGGWLS